MAGLVFPDLVGTLSRVSAMEHAQAQRDYMDEDRKAKASASPFVAKALQGDPAAIGEIATRHPDTAMKLAPLLERLDAGQRARAKEASEYTVQAGMAILNAPPEQQPQLYARARQEAQSRGLDVSRWPTQYDPGFVKFYVDKAMPIAEYYKRSGEGVSFAPPVGGAPPSAAPAGGGVNPNNIGNVRPVGATSGFQQPATFDDGVRLAVNNVKAYPGKFNNGQPMNLYQIGERWAPKGDGANDPRQWAANVASIGGLDPSKPLDFNDPATAAAFARGVHGAEHGAGKALPVEQYARILSGGAPPHIAQGADAPPGDASGNPIQPVQSIQQLRGLQLPAGARIALRKGVPVVQDGNVMYLDANGQWGAVPLPSRKEPKEQTGPFAGTSMDAQAMNMLLNGDPASPQYALAYSHLSKPRTTIDAEGRAVTIQPMDLSAVRKPIAQPSAPAAAPAASPPPDGTTTQSIPGGGSVSVSPPVAPKGPSAKELADLRTARIEAKKMTDALEDFRKQFTDASFGDRAKSLTGTTTPLNTSYNVAALLAKGEQLFNLGVLNGPDLEIIRRTLPDPSTIRGAATNTTDMSAAVDKVIAVLNGALAERERQIGGTAAPTAAAPSSAASKGVYTGPDNSPVSWQEIEATAKNRGISTDEVINKLGLKPTGMQ